MLGDHGFRGVERLSGVDRKTVRRYVIAAVGAGLDRAGAGEQIKVWLDGEALTVAKVRNPLGRQGVVVPART